MAVKHSTRAHAVLSASASARWIACPPSAKLNAEIPDVTTDYAREGTCAHELAEYKVNKLLGIDAPDPTENLDFYDEEMAECTESYAQYIAEQISKYSAPVVMVEQRLDFSKYVPDGFGTGDCIIVADEALIVIDYKHGKGVRTLSALIVMITIGWDVFLPNAVKSTRPTVRDRVNCIRNIAVIVPRTVNLREVPPISTVPWIRQALNAKRQAVSGSFWDFVSRQKIFWTDRLSLKKLKNLVESGKWHSVTLISILYAGERILRKWSLYIRLRNDRLRPSLVPKSTEKPGFSMMFTWTVCGRKERYNDER